MLTDSFEKVALSGCEPKTGKTSSGAGSMNCGSIAMITVLIPFAGPKRSRYTGARRICAQAHAIGQERTTTPEILNWAPKDRNQIGA